MADSQDSVSEEKSEATKSLTFEVPIDGQLRKAIRDHVHYLIFKPEYQEQLGRGKYPSDSEDLLVTQLINAMHIEVERQVKLRVTDMKPSDPDSNIKVNAKSAISGQKGRI